MTDDLRLKIARLVRPNPYKSRVWFYPAGLSPSWWRNLRPGWFGGDEFYRKTIVIGFPWTGEMVVALWQFKEREDDLWFCSNCTAMLDEPDERCYVCDPPPEWLEEA